MNYLLRQRLRVTASYNDGGSAVVGLLRPIFTEAACNDASPVLLAKVLLPKVLLPACRDCV